MEAIPIKEKKRTEKDQLPRFNMIANWKKKENLFGIKMLESTNSSAMSENMTNILQCACNQVVIFANKGLNFVFYDIVMHNWTKIPGCKYEYAEPCWQDD